MHLPTRLFSPSRVAAAFALAAPLYVNAAILPGPNEITTLQYGDFQIYSLQLLDVCSQEDARCQPYQSMSGAAGQISDYLRILAGQPNASNDTAFADDPFYAPGPGESTWQMTAGNEPDPTFTGDRVGSWDIRIDTLTSYLDGNDLVFLFNNNQQGVTEANWLQLWAQAKLYDAAGIEQACFELNNTTNFGCTGSDPALPTSPFDPLSPYVTVFTAYCVDKVTGDAFDLGIASGTNYCETRGGWYVSGNLGNQADNAAYSLGLNNAIYAAGSDWILSIDVRIANNNNGREVLWIDNTTRVIPPPPVPVPSPGSLGLLGLGLLGLALARRRRH